MNLNVSYKILKSLIFIQITNRYKYIELLSSHSIMADLLRLNNKSGVTLLHIAPQR
ncbi:hypothetical protein BOTU111922_10940 [Bordetella tumulicola]